MKKNTTQSVEKIRRLKKASKRRKGESYSAKYSKTIIEGTKTLSMSSEFYVTTKVCMMKK